MFYKKRQCDILNYALVITQLIDFKIRFRFIMFIQGRVTRVPWNLNPFSP